MRLRCAEQEDRGPGRGAELDQRSEVGKPGFRGPARGGDEVEHVLLDPVVGVDGLHQLPGPEDPLRLDHLSSGRLLHGGHPVQHLALFPPLGIGHDQLEHEPVHLRLGQGIGPLVLDRVLGGEHQEQLGQWICPAADRHLFLLHRFQQRALHLGGRAVDLVGQQEIGEDRALLHREVAGPLVVDHRADQVGRQQVRGELNAVERSRDGRGEGPHRQRLRQAGNALEQHMAVGEQPDQQSLQHGPLTHDDTPELLQELRGEPGVVLDLRGGQQIGAGPFRKGCHHLNVAQRMQGGTAMRNPSRRPSVRQPVPPFVEAPCPGLQP